MFRFLFLVIFTLVGLNYIAGQVRVGAEFSPGLRTGDFANKIDVEDFNEKVGGGIKLWVAYLGYENISLGFKAGYQKFILNVDDYSIEDTVAERFVPIGVTCFLHTGSTDRVDVFSGLEVGYCWYEFASDFEYHNIHCFRLSPSLGVNLNFKNNISMGVAIAHPFILTGKSEIFPGTPYEFKVNAPEWSFLEFNLGIHYTFQKL